MLLVVAAIIGFCLGIVFERKRSDALYVEKNRAHAAAVQKIADYVTAAAVEAKTHWEDQLADVAKAHQDEIARIQKIHEGVVNKVIAGYKMQLEAMGITHVRIGESVPTGTIVNVSLLNSRQLKETGEPWQLIQMNWIDGGKNISAYMAEISTSPAIFAELAKWNGQTIQAPDWLP